MQNATTTNNNKTTTTKQPRRGSNWMLSVARFTSRRFSHCFRKMGSDARSTIEAAEVRGRYHVCFLIVLFFRSRRSSTFIRTPYRSVCYILTLALSKNFVNNFNASYEEKHLAFERQFWGTKMALSNTDDVVYSSDNLTKTKTEMENLLSDYSVVEEAQNYRDSLSDEAPVDLTKTLDIIIRTMNCYSTSPSNKKIREETNKLESELEMARNKMKLGYNLPDGSLKPMSSVGLRNLMRTAAEEETRKAAYEGLRSVGRFICDNNFVKIVKMRNQLAKSLGFVDYYDYKVTNAENMSKIQLFEILDGLEKSTRPLLEAGFKELENRYGSDALKPWNVGFKMTGDIVKKMVNAYLFFGVLWSRFHSLTHFAMVVTNRMHTFRSPSLWSVTFAVILP
jgi:hypothetical protein